MIVYDLDIDTGIQADPPAAVKAIPKSKKTYAILESRSLISPSVQRHLKALLAALFCGFLIWCTLRVAELVIDLEESFANRTRSESIIYVQSKRATFKKNSPTPDLTVP